VTNIVIRQAIESDIEQIVDLNKLVFTKQSFFSVEPSVEIFKWKHYENPFGKSIVLIAFDEQSRKVVGARVFWAWKLKCRNETIKAYQPCDTVVHPEFRNRGLFTKMTIEAIQIAQENDADLLFNFPNAQSLPGYLKLGWTYVSKIEWMFKINNILKCLSFFDSKQNSYVINPLNSDNEKQDLSNGCRFTDEKFNCDYLIKTYKSYEFYIWRYLKNPIYNYKFLSKRINNKECTLVYFEAQRNNSHGIFIVDIIGDNDCLVGAFQVLANSLEGQRASFITSFLTNGLNMETLWKKGYFKTKKKNFVVLPLKLKIDNKAVCMKNWKLTGCMHDCL
jgi:GNAT superfamily N-acetyltransferase